jgi:disulfide bond formation protein DsbB
MIVSINAEAFLPRRTTPRFRYLMANRMTQQTLSVHDHAAQEAAPDAVSVALGRLGPHVALLAASVATAGSLFFSEVLGWVPCTLCWYQRILMYPLTIVLLVGLLRRERKLYQYVLPFTLIGASISTYHYLLQKTDWFPPPPCSAGVPCTVDYINLWGFVTIPFLALTAFGIVALSSLAQLLAEDGTPEGSPATDSARTIIWNRAAAVGIVAAVAVMYVVAESWITRGWG